MQDSGKKKIGVIGAGTMGRGIAQVFALCNYPVVLIDKEEAILFGAMEKIKKRTEPELWDKITSLIEDSTSIDKASDCDLVIEAVFENMETKKKVCKALNSICKENTIIATNTSSFSINELAREVDNPSR